MSPAGDECSKSVHFAVMKSSQNAEAARFLLTLGEFHFGLKRATTSGAGVPKPEVRRIVRQTLLRTSANIGFEGHWRASRRRRGLVIEV
jgi:hypothetical protein